MKKDATAFAMIGAAMIAVLLTALNFLITPGVLWFFYPLYAVIWWPMSVYLCSRKRYFAFSLAGSMLTIAFLAITNIVTSPLTLWFLYTVPPILCWPVGMFARKSMGKLPFVLLFCTVIILYYLAVNLFLTPAYIWAIYPIFLTIWWPLGLYFRTKQKPKQASVVGSLLIIIFFITSNLLNSPYPWALYACFPVIWWPIAIFAGKRLGTLHIAVIGSICTVLWYGALNILLAPGSPWVMFVAFAVLWWPLSVFFYGRGCTQIYAVIMSALSIAFFAAVNLVYSPGALWAYYPAFAILWWPMTMCFARKRKWLGYSLIASLLTIIFLAAVNIITSAGFAWSVFPALCILWWPLSFFFAGKKKPFGFSVCGSLLVVSTLLTVNLLTSAGFIWSLFPVICVLWWPLSVYFAKKQRPFAFAVLGSLLAIILFVSINLLTSPGFLWFVFPSFAVVWWPLSLFFFRNRRLAH